MRDTFGIEKRIKDMIDVFSPSTSGGKRPGRCPSLALRFIVPSPLGWARQTARGFAPEQTEANP